MDNSVLILYILGESSYKIKAGISTKITQREVIAQNEKEFTTDEKIAFTSGEYYVCNTLIDASTDILKVMYMLNKHNVTQRDTLYTLWNKLSREERDNIVESIYCKYYELYELRLKHRNPSANVTQLITPLSEESVNKKIEISFRNIERYKRLGVSSTLPDSDFFSNLAIGLVRHFVTDYLYAGKLSNIQKDYSGAEVFNRLKEILYDEDDRFKKIMRRFDKNYDDTKQL